MHDHFATYQAAAKNLKANPNSKTDAFMVDQWNAMKSLNKQITALKQEVSDTKKRNAEMYNEIDTLETKLQRALGTPALFTMPSLKDTI